MCITSTDFRGGGRNPWSGAYLATSASPKPGRLLEEREGPRPFDIPMEEYNFCQECMRSINERFDEAYECRDKMKNVDDTNSTGTKINGGVDPN